MALFVGLMTGSSMDAIDAALVSIEGSRPRVVDFRHYAIDDQVADRLHGIHLAGYRADLSELGELDSALGDCLGRAVNALLADNHVAPSRVTAIGSHGQTVAHGPTSIWPYTFQIGDPNRIVAATGITTIADFRRMDLATGGQGAPLASALHSEIFRKADRNRAVLNLGGIANLTLLPSDPVKPVLGFDCGPANALLDDWIRTHLGQAYDQAGAWAQSGRFDHELLSIMLREPFFDLDPPKSTGRDHFSMNWLERCLNELGRAIAPVDVQATLVALTVRCIADALKRMNYEPDDLFVCGGGVHNSELLRVLTRALPRCIVESTARHGIDPEAVEAVTFAWLAKRRLDGLPGNLPSVTGARRPVLLGAIYQADRGT
jgi:anhydro-N-acetylmuramic acid kinase